MSLPVKVALGSALTLGALVTGYLASKQGRRLVRETFRGVRRTPLEYQVLAALENHPVLGLRGLDVREEEGGRVALSGTVATPGEERRARRLAASVKGVREARSLLTLNRGLLRRRRGRV